MNQYSLLACLPGRAVGFAVALYAASLTAPAQDWETYPQDGFFAADLAVQPNGAIAYAIQDSPATLRRGDNGGTLWGDHPLPEGAYRVDAIGAAGDGRVFLTGWRYLADGVTRAPRVWVSDDQALHWREVGLFLTSSVFAMSVDAGGNVFLSTTHRVGTTAKFPFSRLVTYRGTLDPTAPLGMIWAAVDDFSTAEQYQHYPYSLTIRPSADAEQPAVIWVAGHAIDAKTLNTVVPVVRRSLDGGATWASVVAWTVPSGYTFTSGSRDVVACADANGVAYVAASYGKKVGKTTQRYWLTFRSLDHGASWVLMDIYPVGLMDYGPSNLATDALGGVFICGGGRVRASADGGFQWASPVLALAHSTAADLVGNVFIGGSAIYKLPASETSAPALLP